MKFTSEEIALCREIGKYYRKPMNPGDWFYFEKYNRIEFVDDIFFKNREIPLKGIQLSTPTQYPSYPEPIDYFPIWTWQDAREWLTRKRYWFRLDYHPDCNPKYKLQLFKNTLNSIYEEGGKTDLEAILKVILAILKESLDSGRREDEKI